MLVEANLLVDQPTTSSIPLNTQSFRPGRASVLSANGPPNGES